MPDQLFRDRIEAGRLLGAAVAERCGGREGNLVLALPRGGVPVALGVAEALGAPLDVFVVRKLGVPGHEEWAMGAIASGGVRVMNQDVLDQAGTGPEVIESVAAREQLVLERRERLFRGQKPPLAISGHQVIVVDDGLATGSSMRAAVRALRAMGPASITIAVPVGPRSTCLDLHAGGENVICLRTPDPFEAVGRWYRDFEQTTDGEVRELLLLG